MINDSFTIDKIITRAIEEDLGTGDITTDTIISPDLKGEAVLISRERIILAGIHVFSRVFTLLDPGVRFEYHHEDGDMVLPGAFICQISGRLSSILKAERTALNFLQRMSGIATLTGEYVKKAGPCRAKILDTRKTAPGLRVLDKYSVRVGGGFNHRIGLFDGILIKDNHIAAAGSITAAVNMARKNAPHTIKIEVEVENIDGVKEALDGRVDTILLDNMTVEEIRKAVKTIDSRALIEVSGGINLSTISEIAGTGVDLISVGALTHSVKAADLSLEIVQQDNAAL
jgi:nicotinate-nucleotide pyrophosphorylase (carboxylating)